MTFKISPVSLHISMIFNPTLNKFQGLACEISGYIDNVILTNSLMTLAACSYDRYLLITKPLIYKREMTGKKIIQILFATWILSMSISLPPFFGIGKFEWVLTFFEIEKNWVSTGVLRKNTYRGIIVGEVLLWDRKVRVSNLDCFWYVVSLNFSSWSFYCTPARALGSIVQLQLYLVAGFSREGCPCSRSFVFT